jgi:hypothetical protein
MQLKFKRIRVYFFTSPEGYCSAVKAKIDFFLRKLRIFSISLTCQRYDKVEDLTMKLPDKRRYFQRNKAPLEQQHQQKKKNFTAKNRKLSIS